MSKVDPYAPPQKVTDPDAVSKLDQLLVAFGQMARMFDGLGEELRATVEAVAQRETPTVDLAPLRGDIAALVEKLERQPKQDLKFPPELESLLKQQAAGGISKDDWNDLTQRLQEAVRSSQNAPTVVAGRAGGDMRLKDTSQNVIDPATEGTLAAIQTAVEGPIPAGSNTIGTVLTTSAMSPLNAAGQVFVGGRKVSVGGALSTARAIVALRNPAASGMNINIFALVIYTDVAQWFRYAEDPTLDSPTNHGSTAKSLNRANPSTSPVELITDTLAPTVANYWDAETRVTANAPVAIQLPVPVVIPPGETFAVVGDSSASQNTGINAYFFQTAVG